MPALLCRDASPAHEFFCSRKLRLAPQDYSPWTPPTDPFLVRSRIPRALGSTRNPPRALPYYMVVLDVLPSSADELGGVLVDSTIQPQVLAEVTSRLPPSLHP